MKKNCAMLLITMTISVCGGCGSEVYEINRTVENSVAIEETVENTEIANLEVIEAEESGTVEQTMVIESEEAVMVKEIEVSETIKSDVEEIEVAEDVKINAMETEENEVFEEKELVEDVTEEKKIEYTYTDMNQIMWAKSAVNLRDLPSTDGNKIGSLSNGQEVTVTGQCNETGWYRLEDDKYVSGNYLVDAKPVVNTPISTAANQATTYAPGTVIVCQTYEEAYELCQLGDCIEIAEDGTISVIIGDGTIPNMQAPSYFSNAELAPEILDLINAERANRGLSQVTWDSSLDADALQSAINVEANYTHDSLTIHPGNENIGQGQTSVQQIFDGWMASPGHEVAMMDEYLLSISCARFKNSWVFMGRTDTDKRVADFQQQIDNGEIEPVSSTDVGGGQTIDVYGTPGAVFTEEEALANGTITQEQVDAMNEIAEQFNDLIEQGYSVEEAADIVNTRNGF